jgi:hypothetical protein
VSQDRCPVTGYCDYRNEVFGPMKDAEIFDELSDYQLLNKDLCGVG